MTRSEVDRNSTSLLDVKCHSNTFVGAHQDENDSNSRKNTEKEKPDTKSRLVLHHPPYVSRFLLKING